MFAVSLVAFVIFLGQATANVLSVRTVIERSLEARQFSGGAIPQQCQSICAGTITVLTGGGCQTPQCLCSETVNVGFQQCLSCDVSLFGPDPAKVASAQRALSQFENGCNNMGLPVASLIITPPAAATPPPPPPPPPATTPAAPAVTTPTTTSTTSSLTTSSSSVAAPTLTRSVITPSTTASTTNSLPTDAPVIPDVPNAATGKGERLLVTTIGLAGACLVGMMLTTGL
ncbi:hypothetical protein BXZ70DRAFT_508792 [Cristinia sonorae]|uniref:Extracellular membrane protein CFEM domain-containing protein n=1 Tax=Cristinia sonorae TaxID=1940300 RepID=A0A8K0UVW7_9AGAR|nr:hypothetical protein BXZ70DRAFT_508792 [Cristinia sonorae]